MIKLLIRTINSKTMSLKFQATITTNKNPTPSCCIIPIKIHTSKSNIFTFPSPNPRTHFPNCRFLKPQTLILPITKVKASFDEPYGNGPTTSETRVNNFNLDAFLSVIEFLTLVSSAAVSIYVAFASGVQKGPFLGDKILVWQSVVLVSGVVVGAVIRRRQWRRICGFSRGSSPPSYGANLLARVEKLEEDLRSSATIIRVLSRQLEKLGIRFRVTRKGLKEPIAETAALAQKNSEATRALAAQEDILEKELGEIQKVLLAMQEQQQKQLELILAIGKAGKLWEGKKAPPPQDKNSTSKPSKSSLDGVRLNSEINRGETLGVAEGSQQ